MPKLTASPLRDLGAIFADPQAYADPESWHAAARRIRTESPILRVTRPDHPQFWAITKHSDVYEIERHPDLFTNEPVPVLTASERLKAMADSPVKTLIQMDGSEHKAHRGIVNDWFRPASVKRLEERVNVLAKEAIDHMADLGGSCDFVNDIALHFPLQVILSVLGLPEEDYSRMLTLTQELFGSEDPDIARPGGDDERMSVMLDLVNYFTNLATDRRNCPTEDLASVIANAQIDGEPLADLDMLGHYVIIATAGHDTTSNAIAGGLLALIEHPDQLELLQAQPELINHAADELIRWVTPVKHFMRTCQEPFALRDVTFEAGDLVYLSYASANRDDDVFTDPDRLDVRRQNAANHLGFGFGHHFCLGAHLARMEIRALFHELLPRLDHVELDGNASWIHSYFVQGPKRIPLTYRMRSHT